MKYLKFMMENGEVWGLPVKYIADNRAKYFDGKDTTYQEEYDFVMENADEASDWFFNNMNPEDVQGKIFKLKDAPVLDINFMIRNTVSDYEIIDLDVQEPKHQHSWDASGERCTTCGDKDWMT